MGNINPTLCLDSQSVKMQCSLLKVTYSISGIQESNFPVSFLKPLLTLFHTYLLLSFNLKSKGLEFQFNLIPIFLQT